MFAIQIAQEISDYVRRHSGYQPRRDYLSMSHIADCPLRQYRYFVDGQPGSDELHRMAFLGYRYETMVKTILEQTGILKPVQRELVADFNPLLKGHIDGESTDGDLIEIKSVSRPKFERAQRGPIREHILQMQCYMHFGGYKHGELIYVCREDFSHRVYHVAYDRMQAERLVEKARRVLDAIEKQIPPACECGRCPNGQ